MKSLLMSSLVLTAAAFSLVACGKPENSKPDFLRWSRGTTTKTTGADGTSYEPKYMVDCRKVGIAENVHMYFSVAVDPAKSESKEVEGVKTTRFTEGLFELSESESNTKGNHLKSGGGLLESASLVIEEHADGTKLFKAYQAKKTEGASKLSFETEPILELEQKAGASSAIVRVNDFTENPVVTPNDKIECR